MLRRDSLKWLMGALGGSCLAGGLSTHGTAGAAEAFPARPIKLIVPFPPGGNADFLSRLVGESMAQAFGKAVIVDNRPGANAHVAMQALLREPADGYTIMFSGVNSAVTNLLAMPNAGYDPFRDIQLLAVLVNAPLVVCVAADSPLKNFEDFLAAARAKPGGLSYGTTGIGSSLQLAMEMLSDMAGIELNHVPYKGSAPALADLIAGRLDVMADLGQSSLPFVRAGKLRALAVTSASASPQVPGVEPVARWVPGYSYNIWNGFYARAGIPDEAKTRLQTAVANALADPVVAKRIADSSNVAQAPLTDAQITQMLRAEDRRLRDIVAKRKIQFN